MFHIQKIHPNNSPMVLLKTIIEFVHYFHYFYCKGYSFKKKGGGKRGPRIVSASNACQHFLQSSLIQFILQNMNYLCGVRHSPQLITMFFAIPNVVSYSPISKRSYPRVVEGFNCYVLLFGVSSFALTLQCAHHWRNPLNKSIERFRIIVVRCYLHLCMAIWVLQALSTSKNNLFFPTLKG